MHYIPLVILVWYKVAFMRMFHLMDKENHEDSMLDKALMFPILASIWTAKKVKK